ncbi:MAG: hypothetical protein WDN29_00345 [Methylovirgula sp.]
MSQFFLGVAGMPRRIPDYALQFAPLNMVSSLGAFILGAAQLLLVYNVIRAAAGYGKTGDEPGLGRRGRTRIHAAVAAATSYV